MKKYKNEQEDKYEYGRNNHTNIKTEKKQIRGLNHTHNKNKTKKTEEEEADG